MPAVTLYQHDVRRGLHVPVPSGTTLTGATIVMRLIKPDGSNILVAAEAAVDGNATVKHITRQGDLDQPGRYQLQVELRYTDSPPVLLDPASFEVIAPGQAGSPSDGVTLE